MKLKKPFKILVGHLLLLCVMLMTSVTAGATPGNYSTWLQSKGGITATAKALNTYAGISLKDAKTLLEKDPWEPCYVLENVTLDEAKTLAKALIEAGGKAKVVDMRIGLDSKVGLGYFDADGAYFGPEDGYLIGSATDKGAFITGDYTSPFKQYLGKTDKEIQEKLDQLWNHYFKGGMSQKIYYDMGEEAYILDTNNNDVRSEGLAWGMMIAVQTNHREEFDKIWNWTKEHHWHKAGEWNGYFAWQRKTDGSGKDDAPAPDAELYFMMSLLFAANRWDDSQYMDDAQYILDKMWSNYEHKLFNQQSFVVSFQPTVSWGFFGEPAYDLPAFIELFARWSKNRNYKDQWYKALQATRVHLYKSSHPTTGLFADYSSFDGTPYLASFSKTSNRYMYEAERAAMNFGMDYYLFNKGSDSLQIMAERLIDFFESDDYAHARFDWDGRNPGETYTEGQKGCNAVACYALMGVDGYDEIIRKNLQMAWDVRPLSGQYRYYEGMVHYLSMLHLCGAFKIWKNNESNNTLHIATGQRYVAYDDIFCTADALLGSLNDEATFMSADIKGKTLRPLDGYLVTIGDAGITINGKTAADFTIESTPYYNFKASTTEAPVTVTLSYGSVPEGYIFGGFTVTKADGGTVSVDVADGVYSFAMPADDVTVSVRLMKQLTITAASGTKVYDGTALTKSSYTNTDLSSGDAIESVTVTGSQTVVGTSDNVASAAVIKNASNVDVTANYDITYVKGTLTVTTKTVSAPTITLSQTSYDYNGTAREPEVTVKDGETEIPAGEYTVSYENNTNVGTAKVTITDKEGGNYIVSGSTTFEIKTAEGSVTAPTAKTALIYNGGKQDLITAGSSTTGTIQYSLDGTTYDTAIPQGTDAKEYTVYYKVVAKAGYKDVDPASFKVTIAPKTVSVPTITLSATSFEYDGTAKEPTVTVKDGETIISAEEYSVSYSNNTNAGTATVTITDKEGGNYIVSGSTTFEIKATDDPSTDDPSIDDPSIDDPSIDDPSTDDPSTDNPSTDDPSIDDPSTDDPSTDDPSTDDPSTDDPSTDDVAVTISGAKQVPYCSDKNLDFSNKPELKAYVATGYDKAKGTIWLTRVKQVPANTGFLLMGEAGDYDIPTIDGVSDVYYKNMFKGTLLGETIFTTEGDYTNYYLSKGTSGVGFYKVTNADGQSISANRCYLPILTDIPANGSEGDTETIKVGGALQVPYFTSKNLDFSTMDAKGVKAYTATGYNYKTGIIWLTRVKKVPAQTGVLVMADAAGEYSVPTASVASVYENLFVGSESAQTIYETETIDGIDYVNYYLSKGNYGVGFYKAKAEGVDLGVNRCYLQIPYREKISGARGISTNASSSFSKMIVSDDDDVIGIPLFTEGETGIQSSIFNVQSSDVYYNLQGQRVDRPGKGVYIRNGKKVVIK